MATHHGKEGVVTAGGTGIGELTSYTQTLTAGTSISFILGPEGNASGDEIFTGTGIVTGMTVNVGLDAITTRSVTFQGTGALTRGTV